MDESTSFEMIDRIIPERIRPVLKADGGDITLVDFSEGVVEIVIEKTRVPVTFSKFLVPSKSRPVVHAAGAGYHQWLYGMAF